MDKKLMKADSGGSDFGLIGRGIEVSGDIAFNDQLRVGGTVNGSVSSEGGTLTIDEAGHVDAQVDVGVCIIHGVVNGNIRAKNKVEIRKTGRVTGDVATPILLVEEGAVFNGGIKMGADITTHRLEKVSDEESAGRRQFRGA